MVLESSCVKPAVRRFLIPPAQIPGAHESQLPVQAVRGKIDCHIKAAATDVVILYKLLQDQHIRQRLQIQQLVHRLKGRHVFRRHKPQVLIQPHCPAEFCRFVQHAVYAFQPGFNILLLPAAHYVALDCVIGLLHHTLPSGYILNIRFFPDNETGVFVIRIIIHFQQIADICPGFSFFRLIDVHPVFGRLVLLTKKVDPQILFIQVQVHKHAVAAVVPAPEDGFCKLKAHIVRAEMPVSPQQHPVPVFPTLMQAEDVLLFLKTDPVWFLFPLFSRGIPTHPDAAFY